MSLAVTCVCGFCMVEELVPLEFSEVIFDDGTVQSFEECRRCGYIRINSHEYPWIRNGIAYHRHDNYYYWHPVSRKHQKL